MRTHIVLSVVVLVALAATGCGGDGGPDSASGGTTGSGGAATAGAGGQGGAGGSEPLDKAAPCASSFGDALTDSFGRIDGTVLAVVGPTDSQCAKPNNDHLVVQVLMDGAAYRMVVNVQSDFGDPDVLLLEKQKPLAGPAWSEGWHTDVGLDYVGDLAANQQDFTAYPMAELVERVTAELVLGAAISVFATSGSGVVDSAHLIHRNETHRDGAIVLEPDSDSPRYLLFAFANQSF